MVSLDPEMFGLNKLMDFLFPKKEKYINEKIVYYLRVYTDLIRAEGSLSKDQIRRSMNLMKVVRNMAKNNPFKEEELFFNRLHNISNELILDMRKLQRKWRNPDNVQTKLQLAQNICILRILKRG